MSHRQGAHIATRHSQVPGVCAWTLQTQELATRSRADPTASVCNSSAAGGALLRPTSSIEARPGESLAPAFPATQPTSSSFGGNYYV